jgi:hypothetical protein
MGISGMNCSRACIPPIPSIPFIPAFKEAKQWHEKSSSWGRGRQA